MAGGGAKMRVDDRGEALPTLWHFTRDLENLPPLLVERRMSAKAHG